MVEWVKVTTAGVAGVLAAAAVYSGRMFLRNCSRQPLAVAEEGQAGIAACVVMGTAWAASTFFAGAAGAGGWTYDSGSANSTK